jgi:hypothetical protein
MESPSRLLYKTSIWIIIVYEKFQFGSTNHPSMVREVSPTQLITNFLLIGNSENNNMSFLQVCSTSNPQFQIWLLKKQTYALSPDWQMKSFCTVTQSPNHNFDFSFTTKNLVIHDYIHMTFSDFVIDHTASRTNCQISS